MARIPLRRYIVTRFSGSNPRKSGGGRLHIAARVLVSSLPQEPIGPFRRAGLQARRPTPASRAGLQARFFRLSHINNIHVISFVHWPIVRLVAAGLSATGRVARATRRRVVESGPIRCDWLKPRRFAGAKHVYMVRTRAAIPPSAWVNVQRRLDRVHSIDYNWPLGHPPAAGWPGISIRFLETRRK